MACIGYGGRVASTRIRQNFKSSLQAQKPPDEVGNLNDLFDYGQHDA
jgi:hypothetical protein